MYTWHIRRKIFQWKVEITFNILFREIRRKIRKETSNSVTFINGSRYELRHKLDGVRTLRRRRYCRK